MHKAQNFITGTETLMDSVSDPPGLRNTASPDPNTELV